MNIQQQLKEPAEGRKFDFTQQCFYCGKVCFFDSKYPNRNPFEMVAIKDIGIYNITLELYESYIDDAKLNSVKGLLLRYLCFAVIIVKHFQDLQIFVTD